jgi:rare lipoprotein A (peptidoglycan hydrolase)
MKQIMLHSKSDLPALQAFVVPTGAINYSGVEKATTVHDPFLGEWLSSVALVTLVGILVISGCTSKDTDDISNTRHKQIPQEQGNTTAKPVKKEVGEASWYGSGLQGQETASGETFDKKDLTAAHPSLPMGTMAKVTNLENGKKVEVRINDRGPFSQDRAIDLSSAAANKLGMKKDGTAQVKIETKPTKKSSRKKRSVKKVTAVH